MLHYSASGDDYESISTTVTALPCQSVICTEVNIINDEAVESLEETFSLQLERTPGLDYRISLEEIPATITITDNDGIPHSESALVVLCYNILLSVAKFGVRETFVEIYDNETDFEVCVEAKPPNDNSACPVDFEFHLKLFIEGETDGKLLKQNFSTCLLPRIGWIWQNILTEGHNFFYRYR